jgi:hypothetical protein
MVEKLGILLIKLSAFDDRTASSLAVQHLTEILSANLVRFITLDLMFVIT